MGWKGRQGWGLGFGLIRKLERGGGADISRGVVEGSKIRVKGRGFA